MLCNVRILLHDASKSHFRSRVYHRKPYLGDAGFCNPDVCSSNSLDLGHTGNNAKQYVSCSYLNIVKTKTAGQYDDIG